MIGQSLVFVCAAVALVAGSCFESCNVQGVSQQVVATPVVSSNVFSTGTVSAPVSTYGSSVVSDAVLSSGYSTGVIAERAVPLTDGPSSTPISVIQAPPVTLPTVAGPVVSLPSQPIPAPRVVSHRCVCTKTIVKPQIIQRQVTVPKVQRYLKRTVTPIVENLSYKSTPYTRGYSAVSGVSSSPAVVSSPSSGSQVSYVSAPVVSSSPAVVSSASSGSQVSYVSAPVVSSRVSSCRCY